MPVGSVYAVHTFLEKYCGVRWYLPGDIGEVCPTQTTLTASDVHLRTRPWTRCRWSSRQTYRDPLKFYGWRQPDERVCIPVRDMALWMFRMKMGGSPYACNHAFTHYYERFGKTHPEWWKDGKPSDQYPHPDYANPELIRQAAQDAIEYFSTGKKYPGATADGDYFAIMPNDGKKGLIWSAAGERLRNNDPDRQAGYSCGWGSELVFQMVNTAAHIVRQKHPGQVDHLFSVRRVFPAAQNDCGLGAQCFHPACRLSRLGLRAAAVEVGNRESGRLEQAHPRAVRVGVLPDAMVPEVQSLSRGVPAARRPIDAVPPPDRRARHVLRGLGRQTAHGSL